jgi:hypothetical protein
MSDICKAKYRWTRDELVRAMQQHQQLKLRRGVLMIIKVFSGVLLAFVGLMVIAWVLLPSTSTPPFWAMLLLAMFSFYWLTFDRLNAWYWVRGFAKRPDANVQIEWQFSKEEINIQTELGKATVTWKSFFKVAETSDGFLFYPLKKIFHWLPFSAFESPECIDKVRELILQNGYSLQNRER